jgi:hypothetical protein
MPTWTPEEQLTFHVAFALKKVTVPRLPESAI